MKKLILGIAMTLLAIVGMAATGKSDKPVLRFNQDGKFRILQVTDLHYNYNSYRSDSTIALVLEGMKREKPDLVVFTGDVVVSDNTRKAWLALTKPFTEAGVPWAVVLGNHDIEHDLTSQEIMELISDRPYSVSEPGPSLVDGAGNYILPVLTHDTPGENAKTAAVLYFFDSHRSSLNPQGYDWIHFNQIDWYRNNSKMLTAKNGGTPFPALAFFHIPFPEYNEIVDSLTTYGLMKETVCSPRVNSGLYTSMLEMGDVMGVFVGHDHDNNYIGCLHGICLAYGQSTGRECYGQINKGYRVIDLYENERKFDTWVRVTREFDREKDVWAPQTNAHDEYRVSYPDSFTGKK